MFCGAIKYRVIISMYFTFTGIGYHKNFKKIESFQEKILSFIIIIKAHNSIFFSVLEITNKKLHLHPCPWIPQRYNIPMIFPSMKTIIYTFSTLHEKICVNTMIFYYVCIVWCILHQNTYEEHLIWIIIHTLLQSNPKLYSLLHYFLLL